MSSSRSTQPITANGFQAQLYVLPVDDPTEDCTHAVYVDVVMRQRADGSWVEIPDPIGAPRYGTSHQHALHLYADAFHDWAKSQPHGQTWPD